MSVTFDALFRAMSEDKVFSKLIVTLLIVIISVFAVRFINVFLSRWKKKFITALAKTDPAAVSPAETKITITRRIVTAGIYFFAFTIFLMQFETVRTVGAGLLASAGVAGIVIGIAAQGALSNIIAGMEKRRMFISSIFRRLLPRSGASRRLMPRLIFARGSSANTRYM